jgi:hypothetical protein
MYESESVGEHGACGFLGQYNGFEKSFQTIMGGWEKGNKSLPINKRAYTHSSKD